MTPRIGPFPKSNSRPEISTIIVQQTVAADRDNVRPFEVIRLVLIGLALLIASVVPAGAAEVISSFDSDITVQSDGTLAVTETISVIAEGQNIKRGIYRDFPLMFEDETGREREVGFKLLSVTKDGAKEPHFVRRQGRFLRIYIGDEDVFLSDGAYQYVIAYETDRQIRRFDTYDELFWNVTGTGWDFPIETASATVTLPEGGAIEGLVAYTGAHGSTAGNARGMTSNNGRSASFETTAPLGVREGLTIGVKFQKGLIASPSAIQDAGWFWRDHKATIMAYIVVAILFFYYLWIWSRVGRDPKRGIVVPRWDPPDNISPALTNYIREKGFSGKGLDALSAALLNLAVKGYVRLENLSDDLIILRTDKALREHLPVGEESLLNSISDRGELTIDKKNKNTVKAMVSSFTRAMENEHRSVFYHANTGWVVLGVLISIVGLIPIVVTSGFVPELVPLIMVMVFFSFVLTFITTRIAKVLTRTMSLAVKMRSVMVLGVTAALMIPGLFAQTGALLFPLTHPGLLAGVGALFMINFIFLFLMGAPTPIGQKMMEGIDGLRTYLKLAEKDRLNLAGAPTMSPQHFETLLPYAVALGVEKPWSEAFDAWLLTATAAGTAVSYMPSWQRGLHSGSRSITDSVGSIGKSMSSSFTAAMPAPKSSSSGFSSGGSSGGGGGGGGGGGW